MGPWFGRGELGLNYDKMNENNKGYCRKQNYFNVPQDSQGRSVLTEEKDHFTCKELEVFSISRI